MVPGISSYLNTEAAAGGRHLSAALLSSQSCCSALQVPFEIFGLGQFANYVEKLTISIPPSREVNRLFSKIIGLTFWTTFNLYTFIYNYQKWKNYLII